jgi:hypothetical protein
MAFDQSTRNRLQKFVSDSRAILTEEFTRQLQATYGMDPKSGTIAELETLTFLDNQGRQTATILRETLAHYVAGLPGKSEKARIQQALDRIIREQAFTVLNRLGALRMAEARGFLLESIAKGPSSQGFQLYKNLAGTALGETGDAYRHYLFSLFDELTFDLPALFDRHSPQGLLFPRESALLAQLEEINHFEIEHLWAEDETIGWIYQYFNSQEERKKMRKDSPTPRNSRELAVRNQFFTPRYVVEFLVDNTLGRLWVEATGGQSALRDRCAYLLTTPDETFPAAAPRDPRTLKLLDPACGSMHFGLYAFDLFLEIYREAWDWEQEYGPGSLDTAGQPLKPLSQSYADAAAYLMDVPRLIVEENIFGVDIDPRAAQIAALALWLRAQRDWHEADIKAQNRPLIGQGNVVPAVAPPTEIELRDEFANRLDFLDAELFSETLDLLKGIPEQGVLLQVETELPNLIKEIFKGHGDLFAQDDSKQWKKAETRLRKALADFSMAAQSSYQGHLFAEDALQGLRLIDLCNERFDVVVMNPPFGALAANSKKSLAKAYPASKNDLLAIFVERSFELLRPGGRIGSITSRTCFFLSSYQKWREQVVLGLGRPEVFADFGFGVMDDAMVEAAAYVLLKDETESSVPTTFLRLLNDKDKAEHLPASCTAFRTGENDSRTFKVNSDSFLAVPGAPFAYWVSQAVRDAFVVFPSFEAENRKACVGLSTKNDFAFLRLNWEVSSEIKGWTEFVKGGAYSQYYADPHLVLDWIDSGRRLKAFCEFRSKQIFGVGSWSRWINNWNDYFRPGVTWPRRTNGLSFRVMPKNCIFADKGPAIFVEDDSPNSLLANLALINSKAFGLLVSVQLARTELAQSFEVGIIQNTPVPDLTDAQEADLAALARQAWSLKRTLDTIEETSHAFSLPAALRSRLVDYDPQAIQAKLATIQTEIDELAFDLYGFSETDRAAAMPEVDSDEKPKKKKAEPDENAGLLSWALGVAMGRFDWRLATGERPAPAEPEPFDSLPSLSPGMLPTDAEPFQTHAGILPDDPSHPLDIARLMEQVLTRVDAPIPTDLRRWLQRDFFDKHLKGYSKSRRSAPVYWPLTTPTGSFTLWVYYPTLGNQTLYSCVNDFVEPKLKTVTDECNGLRNKSARSSAEEKEFAQLSDFEAELKDFRDELLRLAKFWKPNRNDGVQITAAPLWKLFQHNTWQKKLKETWEQLEHGDYDWAHLACTLWPERVLRKCHEDRSLAIAHDVEDHFWEEVEVPVIRRGKDTGETKMEWQQKELTESQVNTLVQQLIAEIK